VETFLHRVGVERSNALHRKHIRSEGTPNEYAFIAWECRILQLSQRRSATARYHRGIITTEWLRTLASLSTTADGPVRAVKYLATAGITLVVEPHLPQTYLDGAALNVDERPVIGMTLRYDRIDNFWFVLFHELAHLVLHLGTKRVTDAFLDDLDAKGDDLERQADEFASDSLIPRETWEVSVARFFRTEENIQALAAKLAINPAIVAGRIRNEAGNYIILGEFVGLGEVRKHFKEVPFGQ
jgi:HTH-type transcriptional regulator / antitoxin HigA